MTECVQHFYLGLQNETTPCQCGFDRYEPITNHVLLLLPRESLIILVAQVGFDEGDEKHKVGKKCANAGQRKAKSNN